MSRYLHSRPSVNAGASDTASFPPIQFKVAKFPSFFLFYFFPPSLQQKAPSSSFLENEVLSTVSTT